MKTPIFSSNFLLNNKRTDHRIHYSRYLALFLCIALSFSLFFGCTSNSVNDNLSPGPASTGTSEANTAVSKEFEAELNSLFQTEITSNTLNLHYTLKDPASYGITDYPITLGETEFDSSKKSKSLKKVLKTIESYDKAALSTKEQLTFDLLEDHLHTQLALCDYNNFQEPLIPLNGIQSQLPILFAEYTFSNEADVNDYLTLLAQTDIYFSSIIDFEREKAKAGLFMSDSECSDIIHECESFIAEPDKNYLLTTFENRIKNISDLSETKTTDYLKMNQSVVHNSVIPAYELLISGLTDLMGTGRNDWGLCYSPEGRDYYKLLVYTDTGFSGTLKDLDDQIAAQRSKDLFACANIASSNPDTLQACANCQIDMSDPDAILQSLQQSMLADFPQPPATTCTVNYVDPSLEKYLAPAFYITAPLDSYIDNNIYINSASSYPDIYYFTTLAHEAYPGHLYQTVMSYSSGLDHVRSLLNYPGYVEGWATYVEMQSYYYANLDANVASMLQHNQAATLSLYATSDIGIHYHGWTADDMTNFWGKYGITDSNSIKEITGLIVSNPGNYLKYYVGYLGFLSLKEKMQEKYGEQFSNTKFHQTVLTIGPAPFDLIEEYFDSYWVAKNKLTE